jgi:hypothetical protein
MSPPNGTCETRNIKSGSEKRIVAGHVSDITSGAAETLLWIMCPRRSQRPAAYTAKTSKIGLEIPAATCASTGEVKLLSVTNGLYDPPLPVGAVRGCS